MHAAALQTYADPNPRPVRSTRSSRSPGTATTYAAIELGIARYEESPPHGARLSLDALEKRIATLAALPLAARGQVVGLDAKRADVIVAGGIVLLEAARALGAREIVISDRGVRWGLADELVHAVE